MFNESEAYMNSIANTCTKEPVFHCPQCNTELFTEWVDNGFGPYSIQASPYGCECGWHETGCKECIKEKCFSWAKCQGRALINVNPAVKDSVNIDMNNYDPNAQQAPANQEAIAEQAIQETPVNTNAAELVAQDQALDAEEGGVEG